MFGLHGKLLTAPRHKLVLQRCVYKTRSLYQPTYKSNKRKNSLWEGIACTSVVVGAVLYCKSTECEQLEANATYTESKTLPPCFSVDGLQEFSSIIVGGGTAGCIVAYFTAKWMQDNNIPGTVLLVDRGPDFTPEEGPNVDISSWFYNWGSFGESHPSFREDGSQNPVTVSEVYELVCTFEHLYLYFITN